MARLHPAAVFELVQELRSAAADGGPLAVGGAPVLAAALARELRRGGDSGAVREHGAEDAAALVYVLAAPPDASDRRALKAARRRHVPIVCVLADPGLDARGVPYVLATDVVRVPAGAGFPVDEIAAVLAHRLGERGTGLAARLPCLRGPVCDELVEKFSREAGLLGALVFVPGADLPVLALKQLRLVLRIAAAHGVDVDADRLPEILAVIGSGIVFRAVARQFLGAVPVAGWLVKGAVAYAGTRALGEAAVRYFARTANLARPPV